jgi:hypothetical protein
MDQLTGLTEEARELALQRFRPIHLILSRTSHCSLWRGPQAFRTEPRNAGLVSLSIGDNSSEWDPDGPRGAREPNDVTRVLNLLWVRVSGQLCGASGSFRHGPPPASRQRPVSKLAGGGSFREPNCAELNKLVQPLIWLTAQLVTTRSHERNRSTLGD